MKFSPIHHINGGTFLTNFSKTDRHIYEEAIRRYGKDDLEICCAAYTNTGFLLEDCCSLHRNPKSHGDLSVFWEIHRQVEEERKGKDIVIVFMDGTMKTFSGVKEIR